MIKGGGMQLEQKENFTNSLEMITHLQKVLWNQFGASIDMLNDIIAMWPDQYWNLDNKFYYLCFHTFLFLDYYLTIPPTNYTPPLPFTMISPEEIPHYAVDDLLPCKLYTKKELLDSLQTCRQKCKHLIFGLAHETLEHPWLDQPDDIVGGSTLRYSVLEILLYNLKHVQHHVGQLNLLLRKETGQAVAWISNVQD